jgi:crotonobetainyl-CoA:carnitine CoA-transferase CaiB-like acyl-CoA transferase
MGRMECSDGYVVCWVVENHHWRELVDLMGNPDWASGDEWNSFPYRMGHLFEIGEKMDEWARTQKKEDFHHQGAARGFAVGTIYDAEEVLNNRQYQGRDYFVDVEHPQAGKLRYAGWPYKMSASPPQVSRPAPLLGQHNDEVLRDVLGCSGAECEALRRSGAIWKDASS